MLHLQGVEPGIFRVVAGRLGETLEEQLLGEVKNQFISFPRQIHHLVKHLGCYQARSQVDNSLLAAVLGPAMTLKRTEVLVLQNRKIPEWCSMDPCRGRRKRRLLLDSGPAGRGRSLHDESLGRRPEVWCSQTPAS